MECSWCFIVWSVVVLSPVLIHLTFSHRKSKSGLLPPGPPGWPIFGHMFDLGSMPHKSLAGLKQRHGPVVWLRLGSINTMVVLTAKAATELFKNRDLSFADRMVTETMRSHGFHEASLALAPYGAYWRMMKRVMTVEMLVNKRINESAPVRRRCIDDMVQWIHKEAKERLKEAEGNGRGIHLARFVFLASFNMLGNLMLSRDLFNPNSSEGSEFFKAMMGLMEWTGHPNIVNLFPWLKWLDPQGLRRKMDRDLGKALQIVSKFVQERMEQRKCGQMKKDFLEVMLEFQGNGKDEPAKLSIHDLHVVILEIFLAGSETTSSTIEWAMLELLLNPEAMNKVKSELAEVVGLGKKFQETDIDNLKYLQAVVKETLRLHPPIPFLVPRKAVKDTNFMGYYIPKDTQVLINAWAIGRDEECWDDDPLCFKPERFFVCKNIDYKGQNFEFIPFGAGRRICAGVPLAHRMLHLVLGSLIHEFDWEIDPVIVRDSLDMEERMGVTVRKLKPLKVIPKKRIV